MIITTIDNIWTPDNIYVHDLDHLALISFNIYHAF